MTSFTFIPRPVKKRITPSAASSAVSGSSASSSRQREVSSTAPVAQTSTSARSQSGHIVSTDRHGSCEIRGSSIESHEKSRQVDPLGHLSADGTRPGEVIGSNTKSKATKAPDLEELSGLVCLALSDFQIWADTDLRRRIDRAPGNDAEYEAVAKSSENMTVDNNQGYISLDYLVHHSSIFRQADTVYPETLLVKAIRAHVPEYLDVRLVFSSKETTYGNKWSKKNDSEVGYQIRRKTPLMDNSKNDWDNLTIYLENIPAHLRSLSGVLKLIFSILPTSSISSASRVQGIMFLPHHRDRPGSIPTCKGFALVVLADHDDVQDILHSYPWEIAQDCRSSSTTCTTQIHTTPEVSDETSEIRRDARRFGLRTLLKPRWEALKAEYLSYRQQLVEEINLYQENEAPHKHLQRSLEGGIRQHQLPGSKSNTAHEEKSVAKSTTEMPQQIAAPVIHANSPFPSGCLIFARNVNTETNKTTLRSLFSQFVKKGNNPSTPELAGDGIDYVDYMKGMDNCHLRLSTPTHATQLLTYFSEHPTTQTSGLDGIGKQLSADSQALSVPAMSLELVLGKREQVYWEKVPERICRQAVEKALQIMHGASAAGDKIDDDSGRKKKKQRKI